MPEPNRTSSTAELTSQVSVLNDRVAELEDFVQAQELRAQDEKRQKHTEGKKTSRAAVTGLFALLGAKLGLVLGGNLGSYFHEFQSTSTNGRADIKNRWKEIFGWHIGDIGWKKVTNKDARKHIIAGGIIGLGAGAMLLGIFGWLKGNRIKDPADLIKHPIDSIKRLLGKKVEKDIEEEFDKGLKLHHNQPYLKPLSIPPQANTTNWQQKAGSQGAVAGNYTNAVSAGAGSPGIMK